MLVTFAGLLESTVPALKAPTVWLDNYSMNILNAGEGVLFVTDVCVCVCVCVCIYNCSKPYVPIILFNMSRSDRIGDSPGTLKEGDLGQSQRHPVIYQRS